MDRGAWWAAAHGVATSQTQLHFHFHFPFHALEKEMATHSSVLAWRIPGTLGAWWAAVYGVAQSRTWLKHPSRSSSKLGCGKAATWVTTHTNKIPWWQSMTQFLVDGEVKATIAKVLKQHFPELLKPQRWLCVLWSSCGRVALDSQLRLPSPWKRKKIECWLGDRVC